jgi:hypothetical protein
MLYRNIGFKKMISLNKLTEGNVVALVALSAEILSKSAFNFCIRFGWKLKNIRIIISYLFYQ